MNGSADSVNRRGGSAPCLARRALWRPAAVLAVVLLRPGSVRACAACYGQSDSPLARGMNWGIFSLLGVVAFVLGGVAVFMVYLARRSAAVAAASPAAAQASGQPWRESIQEL